MRIHEPRPAATESGGLAKVTSYGRIEGHRLWGLAAARRYESCAPVGQSRKGHDLWEATKVTIYGTSDASWRNDVLGPRLVRLATPKTTSYGRVPLAVDKGAVDAALRLAAHEVGLPRKGHHLWEPPKVTTHGTVDVSSPAARLCRHPEPHSALQRSLLMVKIVPPDCRIKPQKLP